MVWNEGYVAEVNYIYGFYDELSPSNLGFNALIKLVESPNLNESFTYCELGCGRGYSTNLLAATYPHAQFYANDFNASHIMEAKKLASEAGTKNVHFFDHSFAEFIDQELPEFDFICLHGIYSWISPKNRQAIIDFIKQKLKVGGLVYISYNALPGWAAVMPMRELMKRQIESSTGLISNRINQSISFTDQLIKGNAAYFTQNPHVKPRYEKIKQQNYNYLAHEYFNKDWHPFYFDQVAQDLEIAKLNYIGSAHLVDHLDFFNLSQAAQEQLAQIGNPIYKEVIRDFFLNTQFRRDIFARGVLNMNSQAHIKKLQKTRFALTVPRQTIKFTHQFTLDEFNLKEEIYGSICNALVASPMTIEELQNHPETSKISFNDIYVSLIVMTSIGYTHPAVDEQIYQQRKHSTDMFNNTVKAQAIYNNELNFLASPLIGTGVMVNQFEQLFLLAKSHNQDGAEFVWKILSEQGKTVIKNGKPLETPEENLAHLQSLSEEFNKHRLLTLEKLGIN